MTTLENAARQALEALETRCGTNADERSASGAITALRQALEQPKQEPVVWLDEEKNIIYMHNTHKTDDYHGFKRTTPLYTEPHKREWVGLTREEKAHILDHCTTVASAVKAIEAKLKEKNQ